MIRFSYTTILTISIVVLAAAVVGADQRQSDKSISAGTQTDADNPAASSAGYLIQNGKLIPGPYSVTIEDESIKINGLGIDPSPKPQVVIAVTPTAEARHQVYEAFWAAFPMWVAEDGLDLARQRALEFMKAQPLVEKAYLESESVIQVLFRGEKHEVTFSLNPPQESGLTRDEVHQQFLKDRAESLEYWLSSGCLVILNEGVVMATPPYEGRRMLEELQEAVTSKTDPQERLLAVRKIIPDRAMAEAIAERLGLE